MYTVSQFCPLFFTAYLISYGHYADYRSGSLFTA
jgi:hypothetical protein